MLSKICKKCKKQYVPPSISTNKYWCSWNCYNLARKGVARKEARYSRGYRYLFKPEHPDCSKQGYIAEHRLIGEIKLGRRLSKKEVVHHINGLRDDNRIENIVVCTRAEHNKIDLLIVKGKLKRDKSSCISVTQLDDSKKIIKLWKSRTEVSKNFNCSISCISNAVKNQSKTQGFFWE